MDAVTDAPESPRLTRVTVNLTPRAVEALDVVRIRTGVGKTDVINGALTVYQVVLELMERAGAQPVFVDRAGRSERIHLL